MNCNAKTYRRTDAKRKPVRWADGRVAALFSFCLLAGSVALKSRAAEQPPPPPYADVYARASAEFAEARFFKPAETNTEDLAFKLAPLIIQELKPDAAVATARMGTLELKNKRVGLNIRRGTMYFEPDSVVLNGKPHARFTYVWFYPGENQAGKGASLAAQGIRITLGTTGAPLIWEILTDSSGLELVFVGQSLEAAAAAQFGKPLPGRSFACERGTNEAPETVVARVLDDGPVPMGPILYLSAGGGVSTVICRCMPAQAKTLAGTDSFDLVKEPMQSPDSLPARARAQWRGIPAFWPGEGLPAQRLEKCLRLPSAF